MKSPQLQRSAAVILLACASLLYAASKDAGYSSAKLDKRGSLHIRATSGKQFLAPQLKDQVAFSEVKVSPDATTVGWFADYPNAAVPGYQADPISLDLVLFRDDRVFRKFNTDQTFWDWDFRQDGAQVVYCTGPLHGGATECVLRDVATGKIVERWPVIQDGQPPEWAAGLRY